MKGLAATWITVGVSLATNLIAIPLYLRTLDASDFGLWVVVSAIVAYFGLFNLGVTQSTANTVGAAVSRGRIDMARRSVATGFWVFVKLACAGMLIAGACVVFLPVPLLFKHSTHSDQFLRSLVLLASALFLVQLPFTVFGACLRAVGRVAAHQWISCAQLVLRLLAGGGAVLMGGGILSLIVALGIVDITAGGVLLARFHRELGGVELHPRLYDRGLATELRSPSSYFFILQIASSVAFTLDPLVISTTLGTSSVTAYAVAQRLTIMCTGLVAAIAANTAPVLLRLHAKSEPSQLGATLRRGGSASIAVGAGFALLAGLFGRSALGYWAGPLNVVDMPTFLSMAVLVGIQAVLLPLDALLVVTNNHRRYAIAAVWEASLNLGLSIVLLPYLGVFGVALATTFARTVGSAPVMIWESRRVIGADVWKTIGDGFLMALAGAMPVLITVAVAQPHVSSVVGLGAWTGVCGVEYALSAGACRRAIVNRRMAGDSAGAW